MTALILDEIDQNSFLLLIQKVTTKCAELTTLLLTVGLTKTFNNEHYESLVSCIRKSKYLNSLKIPTAEISPFFLDCIGKTLESLISL